MALTAESTSTTRLPKDLLKDRVAIVTGGSRGIGRATALRLAEAGAHVVVNYAHNSEAADDVVKGLREGGVHAISVQADVADPGQSALLAQYAIEKFGTIDVLVANAGIWKGAPVEDMAEEVWDEVIDVNLKGTWTSVRSVVPQMKLQKKGSIVIVSSTAGQRGEAGYSNYAASKGGLRRAWLGGYRTQRSRLRYRRSLQGPRHEGDSASTSRHPRRCRALYRLPRQRLVATHHRRSYQSQRRFRPLRISLLPEEAERPIRSLFFIHSRELKCSHPDTLFAGRTPRRCSTKRKPISSQRLKTLGGWRLDCNFKIQRK
jgi:NADP-dependent 3-hydroxy acid dehydrogenase YdfG